MLSTSVKFVAGHPLNPASLSSLRMLSGQDPYPPIADRSLAQRDGNSADELRGDEFRTRLPIQSRRFRPKPKPPPTNCPLRTFLSKLRQRAQVQARSQESPSLRQPLAAWQPGLVELAAL